jgi:hypothetical protein
MIENETALSDRQKRMCRTFKVSILTPQHGALIKNFCELPHHQVSDKYIEVECSGLPVAVHVEGPWEFFVLGFVLEVHGVE